MSLTEHHDIDNLVLVANALADAAAQITLRHFRASGLAAENKLAGSDFDPVTVADRGAEEAMRAVLAIRRPDDGVFGEEQAQTAGTSGLTWVLDPIDGTRAFISGLPVWGTLIGLDDGQSGRIGIIDQPYLGERYIGIPGENGRAVFSSRGQERPLQTRSGVPLSQATFFTTDPFLFNDSETQAFQNIRAKARLTRYGTDCYAYALLAMGMIDAVVETDLQPYDIAANIPVITAAGGVVTNWSGGDCRWGGQAVAAATPELHAELLEILAPAARAAD